MPLLFGKQLGRVGVIEDEATAGTIALVKLDDDITYSQQNAIITKVGLSASGNFQFLHTIGNDVYIYVFGDRMGQIVLHGISFQIGGCNDAPATGHGFDNIFDWYTKNRIAAKKEPVVVTIGHKTAFKGFILSLNSDVQDTETRTIGFQITIAILPESH